MKNETGGFQKMLTNQIGEAPDYELLEIQW